MRTFRRFRQLSLGERELLARAVIWLVVVRAMLVLLPFPRVRALLGRASAVPRLTTRSAAEIRWAVLAACRRLPGTRCLPRALALQALLRQAGIASELRIGVAKDARSGIIAHAWVDCDGEALLGEDEELKPYTPLSPLPS